MLSTLNHNTTLLEINKTLFEQYFNHTTPLLIGTITTTLFK